MVGQLLHYQPQMAHKLSCLTAHSYTHGPSYIHTYMAQQSTLGLCLIWNSTMNQLHTFYPAFV